MYSSCGGYYQHLRDARNINRSREKLSDAQLRKIQDNECAAKNESSKKSDNSEDNN